MLCSGKRPDVAFLGALRNIITDVRTAVGADPSTLGRISNPKLMVIHHSRLIVPGIWNVCIRRAAQMSEQSNALSQRSRLKCRKSMDQIAQFGHKESLKCAPAARYCAELSMHTCGRPVQRYSMSEWVSAAGTGAKVKRCWWES